MFEFAQGKPALPTLPIISLCSVCGDGAGFGPIPDGLDIFGAGGAKRLGCFDFCYQYFGGELLFFVEGGV